MSAVKAETDGPGLQTYVETRFNLLNEKIKDIERVHREEMDRFMVTAKEAATATDLRYQQRFEAQSAALAAAFLSQQTAMQTAFQVAEKAVQAALAAADSAWSKSERASDKRFEALNELRQMLNDMMATLITRQEAVQRFDGVAEKIEGSSHRVENLETRFNLLTGSREGGKEMQADMKGDRRASTGQMLTIAGAVIALVGMLLVALRLSLGR